MTKNLLNKKAFTLLELLIVIGIISVISLVTVAVINPAELIKRARDSTRLTDLRAIDSALRVYSANVGSPNFGNPETVYISLPDTSPTCANHTLPPLPSGWTYGCVTQENLQNINGTGWIPVDFTVTPTGSPLSHLPIDPVNTDENRRYYTYATGGSWHITSLLESEKRAHLAAEDGGYDPTMYEVGSNLSISPFVNGMIGYWPLNGNTNDYSGYGNHGTNYGAVSIGSCKVGGCYSFSSASNDYIDMGSFTEANDLSQASIVMWGRRSAVGSRVLLGKQHGSNTHSFAVEFWSDGIIYLGLSNQASYAGGEISSNDTSWHHVVLSFDGTQSGDANRLKGYLDGEQKSLTFSGTISNKTPTLAGNFRIGRIASTYSAGQVDEVRVYARALTSDEIRLIYENEK